MVMVSRERRVQTKRSWSNLLYAAAGNAAQLPSHDGLICDQLQIGKRMRAHGEGRRLAEPFVVLTLYGVIEYRDVGLVLFLMDPRRKVHVCLHGIGCLRGFVQIRVLRHGAW